MPTSSSAPPRRWLPAPAVLGFLLLLAVVFALSFLVGRLAGPVSPEMRPEGETTRTEAPGHGNGGH